MRIINFADGTSWTFEGKDTTGADLTESLAAIMQLSSTTKKSAWHIISERSGTGDKNHCSFPLIFKNNETQSYDRLIINQVPLARNKFDPALQLIKLALIISSGAEANGGILLHGALAEKNGKGIILSGPSDVGKTTASHRLPKPWQALSDDCVLIVRGKDKTFYAHPWPTWSTFFLNGNSEQSWDVQAGIPLRAIFLLTQSTTDYTEPLGKGRAICMLSETARQAWLVLENELTKDDLQKMRTRRFNNICELTRKISCHVLNLSERGTFWKEIEKVLV